MRIIEPWITVENFDGVKIMKNIERACRTCYRSEGLITEDSDKKLLNNCFARSVDNTKIQKILQDEKCG